MDLGGKAVVTKNTSDILVTRIFSSPARQRITPWSWKSAPRASDVSDLSDSINSTPAPQRNAIALNYKDIGRIARRRGYEPTREAAMAALAWCSVSQKHCRDL
jgi:hypothetical protein